MTHFTVGSTLRGEAVRLFRPCSSDGRSGQVFPGEVEVKSPDVDQSNTHPGRMNTFIAASRRAEIETSKLSIVAVVSLVNKACDQIRSISPEAFPERVDWQDFDRG